MDVERVVLLRDALARTGWVERTQQFAKSLRRVPEPGRLLLVGTPEDEPWHFAAHLDDEARRSGLTQLAPTLVRWSVPDGAPKHLSTTLARLEATTRTETVLVVAPADAPEGLLERVADARRIGATVLSMDAGDEELGSLANDRLVVPRRHVNAADLVDLEGISHLVSLAAGDEASMSLRARMARLLDRMSGPALSR